VHAYVVEVWDASRSMNISLVGIPGAVDASAGDGARLEDMNPISWNFGFLDEMNG